METSFSGWYIFCWYVNSFCDRITSSNERNWCVIWVLLFFNTLILGCLEFHVSVS